jgi:hypothetical protein
LRFLVIRLVIKEDILLVTPTIAVHVALVVADVADAVAVEVAAALIKNNKNIKGVDNIEKTCYFVIVVNTCFLWLFIITNNGNK